MARRISEETERRILELYQDRSYTLEQIGEMLGVEPMTVHRKAKLHGLPLRHRTFYDDEFKQKVVEHYLVSNSSTVTSRECNVSPESVLNWVKQAGYKVTRVGRPRKKVF